MHDWGKEFVNNAARIVPGLRHITCFFCTIVFVLFVLITCTYIQLVARPLLHARALVKSMGQITTWDDCAGADMMFFVMKQLGMSSKV